MFDGWFLAWNAMVAIILPFTHVIIVLPSRSTTRSVGVRRFSQVFLNLTPYRLADLGELLQSLCGVIPDSLRYFYIFFVLAYFSK